MRQIQLPNSDKKTSQLGFGCAYLQPETVFLLDVAYDAGIRHFDVARSYGRGQTEFLVGKFLKNKSDDVSICSKFGNRPPISNPLLANARTLLRPIIRKLRKSSPMIQPASKTSQHINIRENFTGDEVVKSLKKSLNFLKRDYLDLFLMHEAQPDDLINPSLLDALQESQAKGLIKSFGVGGDVKRVPELLIKYPQFCELLQYNWNVTDNIEPYAKFDILYRTFSGSLSIIKEILKSNRTLAIEWSKDINYDLLIDGSFETLILKATSDKRKSSIILFSSTSKRNIISNVNAVNNSELSKPADLLVQKIIDYNLENLGL